MKEKPNPLYRSDYNSTREEWIEESGRLLAKLHEKIEHYTNELQKCLNDENYILARFYCLKMQKALECLKIEMIVVSEVALDRTTKLW